MEEGLENRFFSKSGKGGFLWWWLYFEDGGGLVNGQIRKETVLCNTKHCGVQAHGYLGPGDDIHCQFGQIRKITYFDGKQKKFGCADHRGGERPGP